MNRSLQTGQVGPPSTTEVLRSHPLSVVAEGELSKIQCVLSECRHGNALRNSSEILGGYGRIGGWCSYDLSTCRMCRTILKRNSTRTRWHGMPHVEAKVLLKIRTWDPSRYHEA